MDHRIHQVTGRQFLDLTKATQQTKLTNQDFKALLQQEQALKVSKHASRRLHERNINITDRQWTKLSEKVNEADRKGITSSLVVMDDLALVVNAKNKTIVTAMKLQEAQDRIFTNINGTILVDGS